MIIKYLELLQEDAIVALNQALQTVSELNTVRTCIIYDIDEAAIQEVHV